MNEYKTEKVVKINKDLVDASLMLSIISLILTSVSEFSSPVHKNAIIIVLAVAVVALVICRVLAGRQS
ncbi:MAG: hypothetical protein LBP50_00075 [Tannerella sp.]|jgi:hypothetical protein|nr:hypothetical protein [Tannerella sp.]